MMAYKNDTPEVSEAVDDFCRLLIDKSGDPCEGCSAFCPITHTYGSNNNKNDEGRIGD